MNVLEDNWDDDAIEDDFAIQLIKFRQKTPRPNFLNIPHQKDLQTQTKHDQEKHHQQMTLVTTQIQKGFQFSNEHYNKGKVLLKNLKLESLIDQHR